MSYELYFTHFGHEIVLGSDGRYSCNLHPDDRYMKKRWQVWLAIVKAYFHGYRGIKVKQWA